jgi:C-terminal processing protease CtpA/Prc
MKMGDLDKVLDEITDLEVKKKPSDNEDVDGSWNINDIARKGNGRRFQSPFEDSTASIVSDEVVDDDGDEPSEALALMQQELREAEERQQQEVAASKAAGATSSTTTTMLTTDKVVTAIAIKPTPESTIGISMKTTKGVTRIVNVSEAGLLKDSDLRPGLQIVSINGVDVKNAKHARALIQACRETVTLVTFDLSVEV